MGAGKKAKIKNTNANYLSDRMQIYKHYILEMHFAIYHGPPNRIQFLVRQNALHPYRLNKSNGQMQMFLVVFCCDQKERELH